MTPRQHRRLMLLTLALSLPLAVLTSLHLGPYFTHPDAAHYLVLAQGRPAMLPFAGRQLAPLIARALTHLVPLQTAFYLEGLACLIIFASFVAYLLLRTRSPLWLAPALLGLFFWPQQFNWLIFPDLLFAALLSCFLFTLLHRRPTLAALLLFPLTLTRESALLVLLCFLVAGRRRLSLRQILTALTSTALALLLLHHLTRNALPNQEHLSPILYLLAKLPWNLLKNVLGLSPWSNLYPACELPHWQVPLHLGPLQSIGLCGFDPTYPIQSLAAALSAFGLLPLLLLPPNRVPNVPTKRVPHVPTRLHRVDHGEVDQGIDSSPSYPPPLPHILLPFLLLYGAASFLLAPLLGELFPRLYAYAWPLFLVALPLLLARTQATFTSTAAAATFLALHFTLSWSQIYLYPSEILLLAAVIYPLARALLRRTWHYPSNPQQNPSFSHLELL